MLKIDVEGHEFNVLKGAEKLLSSNSVRYIQFEFSEFNMESGVFLRDFFNMLTPRYRIYRILRRGLAPLNTYNTYQEVFKTTNYLAVSDNGQKPEVDIPQQAEGPAVEKGRTNGET